MKVEQIYTGCLAQGAYYIESNGEVAIVDPLREVVPYIEKARKNNASIRYVLETHFHADFVSGHIDLAKETGATIIYGPTAAPSFDAHIAADGELLKLGNVTIKVIHTPGHTMESTCFLLIFPLLSLYTKKSLPFLYSSLPDFLPPNFSPKLYSKISFLCLWK